MEEAEQRYLQWEDQFHGAETDALLSAAPKHVSEKFKRLVVQTQKVTTEYLIKKIPDQNPVLRYGKNLQPVFES